MKTFKDFLEDRMDDLRKALAVHKFKKGGGEIDKQPDNIEKAYGKLSKDDLERAQAISQYKKDKRKKRGNAHIAGSSDSGDKKPEDKEKKKGKRKGYFAVILDPKSHKEVASLASFPSIQSHHVTVAFSPDEKIAEKLDDMVGKNIRINTSDYMKNDEIDALIVSGMSGIKREDPGQAHITISHKERVKPQKSNDMVKSPDTRTPKKLLLHGKFQFVAFKR